MKVYTLKFDKTKKRKYAVDIKEFFDRYQSHKEYQEHEYRVAADGYKMLIGTPLLVNIDGTYVKAEDLPKICNSSPFLLYNYLSLLKNPQEGSEMWNLIWS